MSGVRSCLDELNCMPVVKREDALPKKNMAPARRPSQKETYLLTPVKTNKPNGGWSFFLIDGKLKKTHTNLEDVSTATSEKKSPVGVIPICQIQLFKFATEKRLLVSMMQQKHIGCSVHCTRS